VRSTAAPKSAASTAANRPGAAKAAQKTKIDKHPQPPAAGRPAAKDAPARPPVKSTVKSKAPATKIAAAAAAAPSRPPAAKAVPSKPTAVKPPAVAKAPVATPPARSATVKSAGKPAPPAPPHKPTATYANDQKFLDSQKAALLSERSTYVEQAKSLRAEADSLVEEMEPGDIQFDEESGEGGTVTVDRERDLALSAQALLAVEEIDHALAKIKLGTYGVCEGCGTLIPKNRLDALPYARLCIACKSGGLSRR
jgi:DnaK suppressor protein